MEMGSLRNESHRVLEPGEGRGCHLGPGSSHGVASNPVSLLDRR